MALEGMIPDSTIPLARFLYNNKEFEATGGVYFYGVRLYVPVIGRFAGVDPISEQFAHVSVYNYAENEPVGHIDLWGLQKYYANGQFHKQVGDDQSIRILKPPSPFHKYWDFELMTNSIPAYIQNDENENSTMGNWAANITIVVLNIQ